MKNEKTFLFVTILLMLLSGCGKEEITYKLGETVATDIVELTLDDAKFTVAISNSSENPGEPKEYDSADDSNNPYVAAKGHSLVFLSFTLHNLDRDSLDLCGFINDVFVAVEYDGKTYTAGDDSIELKLVAERVLSETEWGFYSSSNILLSADETTAYRGYLDIPVEGTAEDTFDVTFFLVCYTFCTVDKFTKF